MRKLNRAMKFGCLLALASGGWLAVEPTRADVLDQMPADAAVVIKLNHIAETNTRLGAMLQQLGLTDLMPAMKDPLQALEDSGGFGAGLDTKRDAGAFFTAENLSNGMQGGMAGVALFPVSDFKAFLAGSGDVVRTENETTVIHFKGREDDMFVQQWGDYAAIASSKESLSVKHDGLKPSAASARELASDDVVLFTNFAPLKGKLLPKLDDGEKQLTDLVEKQLTDPAQQQAADAAVKQLIQAAREFLNDAQGSAVGITIGEKGIKGSLTVDLAPGTYLGKLAMTMKQSNGPLLAGLPGAASDYVAFGGFVQDPAWAGKLFDDLVNPISVKLPGMGDDGKKILDILATAKGAVASAEGGVFGAVAPTGQLGQASLIQEVFVMKGDSAKIKSAQAKAMELTGTMMSAAMQLVPHPGGRNGQNANAGGDLFKTTTTPGYKTIAGVLLDRLQVEVNPDNTSPQAMQMSEALSTMYGPDGLDTVAGTIDAKTFFGAVGAPEQLITDAIEATKSNKDVLSDDVKDIDAELPKNRAVAEYFGLGQYLATVLDFVKAKGAKVPITIPRNLPPVGVTVGAENSSLRVDGFVPMPLIQSLFQAGMSAYMQFNGRQNNGGGGGL